MAVNAWHGLKWDIQAFNSTIPIKTLFFIAIFLSRSIRPFSTVITAENIY